jgi:hypothetical protein
MRSGRDVAVGDVEGAAAAARVAVQRGEDLHAREHVLRRVDLLGGLEVVGRDVGGEEDVRGRFERRRLWLSGRRRRPRRAGSGRRRWPGGGGGLEGDRRLRG